MAQPSFLTDLRSQHSPVGECSPLNQPHNKREDHRGSPLSVSLLSDGLGVQEWLHEVQDVLTVHAEHTTGTGTVAVHTK